MKLGYARVSTADQNAQLQMDALVAAGCQRTFSEQVSGAQRDRPQLAAALEFARSGDVIVVWKLDRLARSLSQLLATSDMLNQRGVGLLSLTEDVDTTTPGGRLVFHLFGALAEFERSLIRERTMAGLAAARAAGRHGGRPPSLTNEGRAVAEALLASPCVTADQAASTLGISVSTLYRYFPAARSNALKA